MGDVFFCEVSLYGSCSLIGVTVPILLVREQ